MQTLPREPSSRRGVAWTTEDCDPRQSCDNVHLAAQVSGWGARGLDALCGTWGGGNRQVLPCTLHVFWF